MSFAENLKKIRKEKGFSQEELAEIMNVSRQAVSKWEQGGSLKFFHLSCLHIKKHLEFGYFLFIMVHF